MKIIHLKGGIQSKAETETSIESSCNFPHVNEKFIFSNYLMETLNSKKSCAALQKGDTCTSLALQMTMVIIVSHQWEEVEVAVVVRSRGFGRVVDCKTLYPYCSYSPKAYVQLSYRQKGEILWARNRACEEQNRTRTIQSMVTKCIEATLKP